jgi:uncharacterized protein YndB with AHSA1/START domain
VTDESRSIERRIELAAPSDEVYAYLLDPTKLTVWQVDRVIAFDPNRNGAFRLQTSDGRSVVGRFLEMLPGRRLVMTWGYENSSALPPGASTVEISLVPDGDRTVLHLLHRVEPTERTNSGGTEMGSCEEGQAGSHMDGRRGPDRDRYGPEVTQFRGTPRDGAGV